MWNPEPFYREWRTATLKALPKLNLAAVPAIREGVLSRAYVQGLSPARCGARTRTGSTCRSPIVNGNKRCRMHSGAPGSGAPKGERNGNWKHGGATVNPSAVQDGGANRSK